MTDEQDDTPDVAVPSVAFRSAQVIVLLLVPLVVFGPILVAYLAAGKPRPGLAVSSHIATILAIVFAMLILTVNILMQRMTSGSSAWRGVSPDTCELSRTQRGMHYLSGVILAACLNLWPAEVCLFAYLWERNILAVLVGTGLVILTLLQFPTSERAEAWAKRHFHRSDTLPMI